MALFKASKMPKCHSFILEVMIHILLPQFLYLFLHVSFCIALHLYVNLYFCILFTHFAFVHSQGVGHDVITCMSLHNLIEFL